MRKIGLLMAAIVALAPSVSSAARADDAAMKKEFEAIFNKAVEDFKKKDLKAFMTMFAPGYTSKTLDGRTQTLADTEKDMEQAMAMTKSVDSASQKIEKIRVMGYTAEVTGTMKLSMRVVDKDGAMGKKGATHVMGMEERSKETWIKASGGGWKLKSSVALTGTKSTMDGKPLPSMAGTPPSGKTASKAPSRAKS